jgi:hypothetical protein
MCTIRRQEQWTAVIFSLGEWIFVRRLRLRISQNGIEIAGNGIIFFDFLNPIVSYQEIGIAVPRPRTRQNVRVGAQPLDPSVWPLFELNT